MYKQKQSSLDSFVSSGKTAKKRDHSGSETEQESNNNYFQLGPGLDKTSTVSRSKM